MYNESLRLLIPRDRAYCLRILLTPRYSKQCLQIESKIAVVKMLSFVIVVHLDIHTSVYDNDTVLLSCA